MKFKRRMNILKLCFLILVIVAAVIIPGKLSRRDDINSSDSIKVGAGNDISGFLLDYFTEKTTSESMKIEKISFSDC